MSHFFELTMQEINVWIFKVQDKEMYRGSFKTTVKFMLHQYNFEISDIESAVFKLLSREDEGLDSIGFGLNKYMTSLFSSKNRR